MKDARIFGYFDTKYMTVLRIEQILQVLKTKKLPIFYPKTGQFSRDTPHIWSVFLSKEVGFCMRKGQEAGQLSFGVFYFSRLCIQLVDTVRQFSVE